MATRTGLTLPAAPPRDATVRRMERLDPGLESVFTWAAPPVVFGPGALDETGAHVAALGIRRAAVVTDPGLVRTGLPSRVEASLRTAGIVVISFDRVHVEPTDASIREAVAWSRDAMPHGFVAVGGGSAIDTAKAMNLLLTNHGDLEDYLNKPIGRGLAPDRPLKPLIALPTTAGTGAEATATCVVNVLSLHVKTAISHRALMPSLAIIDPLTTLSLPPEVTAASGMDVLCHALESWTARPFDSRPRAEAPATRPPYNGANPISDIWCARALTLLGRWFRRVMEAPGDVAARTGMMQAAMYAGIGFGNAGVHLPHGMSYPVSGMARDFVPDGYPTDHAIIPHGMSVILHAPAVFRFTAPANPARHLRAAQLLGADVAGAGPDDAGAVLSSAVVQMMRDTGMPNGLSAVGFTPHDVDALVKGTLPQHRVTKLSPRPAGEADLRQLFLDSMTIW